VLVKFMKDTNRNGILSLIDNIKNIHKNSIILLVGEDNGNLPVVCSVNGDALKSYQAGMILRKCCEVLGGSGGGRPDFASGAGKNKDKIDEAINTVKQLVK